MIHKRTIAKTGLTMLTVIVCIFLGCQKKELLVLTSTDGQTDYSLENEQADHGLEDGQTDHGLENEKAAKDSQAYAQKATPAMLVVHICGAVKNPGVYTFSQGERICHAIEAAGGFTSEADRNYLNQALMLADGEQLYIPTEEESKDENGQLKAYDRSGKTKQTDSNESDSQIININTATSELLCTLPGIGSRKAESIIAYREQQGYFQSIEDIMKVSGIKDGMFQKIKDRICV